MNRWALYKGMPPIQGLPPPSAGNDRSNRMAPLICASIKAYKNSGEKAFEMRGHLLDSEIGSKKNYARSIIIV